MIKKVLRKLSQEIKNVTYEFRVRVCSISNVVNRTVPYVCQFARPEHAELSLKKKLSAINDPFWQETGALSPARYAQWAFTMCGMASVAMIIEYFKNKKIKVVELAEDALQNGVYRDEKNELSDMRYREFGQWVTKYGLRACVYTKLSTKGIRYAVSKGKFVIVSVNPNIRGYDTALTSQKGGHLVLVTGYDLSGGTITINNPSGFVSSNTQIGHAIKEEEFIRYYASRGIVVSNIV